MSIKYVCSNCGQKCKSDDEYAGQKVNCVKCGALLEIPNLESIPDQLVEVHDFPPAAAVVMLCTNCGAAIEESYKFCKSCGFALSAKNSPEKDNVKQAAAVDAAKEKADTIEVKPVEAESAKAENSICPVCNSAILPGSAFVACSTCGIKYHPECWKTNLGCSTYGCPMVGSLKPREERKVMAPEIRPWIRFWARMIDYTLLVIVLWAFYKPKTIDSVFEKLILLRLYYIFVEALMLSSWGTTPGKVLLGVKIRKENGTKLNYPEALTRSFRVWWCGDGLGIPFVALIAYLYAYCRIVRDGKTSWDRDGKLVVSHQALTQKYSVGFLKLSSELVRIFTIPKMRYSLYAFIILLVVGITLLIRAVQC